MLKKVSCLFAAMLLWGFCSVPVFASVGAPTNDTAADMQVVSVREVQFSDGDYVTINIEETKEESGPKLKAAEKSKTGKKTWTYHSVLGAEWQYSVTGTFKYNGSSARATKSTGAPTIIRSGWICTNNTAAYSGATAKARGTFKTALLTKNANVSLTCSAKGVLS